jgi:hypothetical protein
LIFAREALAALRGMEVVRAPVGKGRVGTRWDPRESDGAGKTVLILSLQGLKRTSNLQAVICLPNHMRHDALKRLQ